MDNDPEAFHVERDEILWKIVESVAKGKLTQVQVMSLKRRLTPIMREDVWYS
jgi:CRISPR/Cas system-associated endoribonuclease Cas2